MPSLDTKLKHQPDLDTSSTSLRYIIVQAGGKGSRMEHFTWNKPKCLVPIDGRPLLYHLFEQCPDAEFVIVGDYHYETLCSYLKLFPPPVKYKVLKASRSGTCGGLTAALEHIVDPQAAIAVIWCDLLIDDFPKLSIGTRPIVGLSSSFACRWSFRQNKGLVHELSFADGVAGFFAFPNKSFLKSVPQEGEFVAWLAQTTTDFETVSLSHCQEIGNCASALHQWERRGYARFFNDVELLDDIVIKRPRTPASGDRLLEEAEWYEEARDRGFTDLPELIKSSPLTLERIHGEHADVAVLKPQQKFSILQSYFDVLERLHACGSTPANADDCRAVYLDKTLHRVGKILPLIPNRERDTFEINGRLCKNPFAHDGEFIEEAVQSLRCEEFTFIHGDPTFSNSLITSDSRIALFDPRVNFGSSRFFGDPDYDWAKLYYSAIGNYDAFNRRRFKLTVWNEHVSIDIESAEWAFLSSAFADYLGPDRHQKIKLLHALIWLSLAGWVDDDVDSMIGAFFNGLYWLEDWARQS